MKIVDTINGLNPVIILLLLLFVVIIIFSIIIFGGNLSFSKKDGLKISSEGRKKSIVEPLVQIISHQARSLREEYEGVDALKKKSLVDQLNFNDNSFESVETECYGFLRFSYLDHDFKDKLLARMTFKEVHEKLRIRVNEIIKRNHLAKKTDTEFREQAEDLVKNYIQQARESFSLCSDAIDIESFLKKYKERIEKAIKDCFYNSKSVSVTSINDIHAEKLKFKSERKEFMEKILRDNGIDDEDINSIELKIEMD